MENVAGFVVAQNGAHFREAYMALRARGYVVGALLLDTIQFLPQSRARAFVVAVLEGTRLDGLVYKRPTRLLHPKSVLTAHRAVKDPGWVWSTRWLMCWICLGRR